MKKGGAIACCVVGGILFGLGWLNLIPGIVLIALYGAFHNYRSYTGATYYYYYTYTTYAINWPFVLALGIVSVVFGAIFIIVGLPLIIVGAVAYNRHYKRVSFFMDSQDNNTRAGLSIKY